MTKPYDKQKSNVGIVCRNCGCRWLLVKDTRKMPDGRIRRIRICHYCGKRRITYEG